MSVLVFAVQASDEVDSIAKTFGVSWSHLTAQMISFGIVCAILYWLAYKPVLRMLDERRKQITQGLENTAKINAALAEQTGSPSYATIVSCTTKANGTQIKNIVWNKPWTAP